MAGAARLHHGHRRVRRRTARRGAARNGRERRGARASTTRARALRAACAADRARGPAARRRRRADGRGARRARGERAGLCVSSRRRDDRHGRAVRSDARLGDERPRDLQRATRRRAATRPRGPRRGVERQGVRREPRAAVHRGHAAAWRRHLRQLEGRGRARRGERGGSLPPPPRHHAVREHLRAGRPQVHPARARRRARDRPRRAAGDPWRRVARARLPLRRRRRGRVSRARTPPRDARQAGRASRELRHWHEHDGAPARRARSVGERPPAPRADRARAADAVRDPVQSVDAGRARAVLGWLPKVSLRDGLARTVAWYAEYAE